jgi:hypothetical protein
MIENPRDIIDEAKALIDERGAAYGGLESNFERIAALATVRLNRRIHPYEVAVMLDCVKDARKVGNWTHRDSYLDAINYEAFALAFAETYDKFRKETER